jgi:hypothetical protein
MVASAQPEVRSASARTVRLIRTCAEGRRVVPRVPIANRMSTEFHWRAGTTTSFQEASTEVESRVRLAIMTESVADFSLQGHFDIGYCDSLR